jgi:hypothetical protein
MCERRAAVIAEGFMPGQATAANEDSGALIWSSSGPIWGGSIDWTHSSYGLRRMLGMNRSPTFFTIAAVAVL